MSLTENAVTTAVNAPEQSDAPQLERPPLAFLPEGDSTLRLWTNERDGKLEWLREIWAFHRSGIGWFDGDDEWCRQIAKRAKDADPDKKWSWQFQAQRIGIAKGVFYDIPPGADPKYLSINPDAGHSAPTIVVFNSTALKSLRRFMAGQKPADLVKQLDVDNDAMGINFSLKRGSGANCNVSWNLTNYKMPAFTWGGGNPFPHLDQCFVKAGDTPSPTQRDQINSDLQAKIAANSPEAQAVNY